MSNALVFRYKPTTCLRHFLTFFFKASGRNDIVVDDRKISGSAYKLLNDRCLHHGTVLLNVDMSALGKVLNPNKAKLQSNVVFF